MPHSKPEARLRKRVDLDSPDSIATQEKTCATLAQSDTVRADRDEITQQDILDELDFVERYCKSLLVKIAQYKARMKRRMTTA